MRLFYKEYDEIDKDWGVFEEDGGAENNQWFDALMFSVASEEEADNAVNLLMELQGGLV